jgi:hypothetical protein
MPLPVGPGICAKKIDMLVASSNSEKDFLLSYHKFSTMKQAAFSWAEPFQSHHLRQAQSSQDQLEEKSISSIFPPIDLENFELASSDDG